MSHKFTAPILLILPILVLATFLSSCNRANTNSGLGTAANNAQSSPAPSPKTGFEADLEYVRKGQYTYVWVFSRKDGKPLDKNDGAYLRTNAPQVVDWVTTEEGKRVIAGTNFDLAKGNLALLQKRFNVEDYTGK
jgi:predicted small secreted protein